MRGQVAVRVALSFLLTISLFVGSKAKAQGAALRSLQQHALSLTTGAPITARDGKDHPTDLAWDVKLGEAKFTEFSKKFDASRIPLEAGDQKKLIERMTAKNGFAAVECIERTGHENHSFLNYAGIAHFLNDYLTREVEISPGHRVSTTEFAKLSGQPELFKSATNSALIIEKTHTPGRSPSYLKTLAKRGDAEDQEFFQRRHFAVSQASVNGLSRDLGPHTTGFLNTTSLERGVSGQSVVYQNSNAYIDVGAGRFPVSIQTISVREVGDGDYIFKIEAKRNAQAEPVRTTYCY